MIDWTRKLLRAVWKAWCVLATALAFAALHACAAAPQPDANYAATLPEEIPVEDAGNGGIFQSGHDVPLFENSVAHRIGDVLTITLDEKTDASKSAITTTKKNTAIDTSAAGLLGGVPTIRGQNPLNNSLSGATSFDGEGGSKQSNQLTGGISVTVVKRLANGNLLVRGQKWITINQGREFVRIQGIVRPVDIGPDNTVSSVRVADATIAYGAQGALNDANSKGWLARFFDSKWLPF